MKQPKTYNSIDDYIEHASIANENGPVCEDIFEEAITILQHMKEISSGPNVVSITCQPPMDITEDEYDELIEWLESLEKTRH